MRSRKPDMDPNIFHIGSVVEDNIHGTWIVMKDKDNSKIWHKLPEEIESYTIHDNGGRPFLVRIFADKIEIYENTNEEKYDEYYPVWKYFKTRFNFEKIFIGKSPRNKMTAFSGGHGTPFDGNSVLVKLHNNTYLFIGLEIYEFSIGNDEIIKYISPVGNNDVPYPYAIGKNKTYLLIECVCIDNKYLSLTNQKDPYDRYYWLDNRGGHWETYKTKIIHKRIW